jgi:hypothetical protein
MVESAETLGTYFHGLNSRNSAAGDNGALCDVYCRNKRLLLFIADAFIMNTFEPLMGIPSALKRSVPSRIEIYLVFVCSGGVRLSPLGTSANIWPIVPAPYDD